MRRKRRGEGWRPGSLQRVLRVLPVRRQQVTEELDSLTIKPGSMYLLPKKSRVRTGLGPLRPRRFGGQDVHLCGSNRLSRARAEQSREVLHVDRRLLGEGEESVLLGDVVSLM